MNRIRRFLSSAETKQLLQVPFKKEYGKEAIDVKRARLLYQARKRGILEADLLLSTFAKERLPKMNEPELDEFHFLLTENDWDLYYWLTGEKAMPNDVKSLSIIPSLVEHCKNNGRKILRMPDL